MTTLCKVLSHYWHLHVYLSYFFYPLPSLLISSLGLSTALLLAFHFTSPPFSPLPLSFFSWISSPLFFYSLLYALHPFSLPSLTFVYFLLPTCQCCVSAFISSPLPRRLIWHLSAFLSPPPLCLPDSHLCFSHVWLQLRMVPLRREPPSVSRPPLQDQRVGLL